MSLKSFAAVLFSVPVILITLASCNDLVVNSNSYDDLRFSLSGLQGGANFKLAVPAIVGKCASCHTHAAWLTFNEEDYQAEGLVIPSDYANSPLYYRLSNSAEGPGPKNMPQAGEPAFTDEEVELLKNWINNFGS